MEMREEGEWKKRNKKEEGEDVVKWLREEKWRTNKSNMERQEEERGERWELGEGDGTKEEEGQTGKTRSGMKSVK